MSGRSRRRRQERPGPSGFLVVDKPSGSTSHDVVDAARRWLGTRRVGHLGTLDPLATGVLPLAVRDATKLIAFVAPGPKVYAGTIRLGVATDTFDAEGAVVSRHQGPLPDEATVRAALAAFEGDIEQLPPMYSSVKHAGEPLHRLARRGEHVERQPRKVRIHSLELLEYRAPELGIRVSCAPGTYVRTLAEDLGTRLGCGAHLAGLRRFQSGPFTLEQAASMEVLEAAAEAGRCEEHLVPPAEALGLPTVALRTEQLRRVAHGAEVEAPPVAVSPPIGSRVAGLDPSGTLVAVLELRPDRRLYPLRVLGSLAPQGSP
jgi:tRNA pseudouridine55 synthase